MTRHRDTVHLRHMLDHALTASELCAKHEMDNLGEEPILRYALLHLLTILGESANRVSASTRETLPDIPWRFIIGMRNRLIHGYDIIDDDLVLRTVTEDLPPLIEQLQIVLKRDETD